MIFQASFFVSALVYGAAFGSVLTLLSIGYSIVYGVGRIINLAHGLFYIFTAYIIFWFMETEILPYPIAVILGLVIISVFSAIYYIALIKPVEHNEINVMIVSFGLAFLVQQGITIYEVAKPEELQDIFLKPIVSGDIEILGVTIDIQYIFIMIITVLVVTVLLLLIKFSKIGKSIRAVSQDKDAAQIMGINVKRVFLFTIVLSAFLAGIAAFLYVPIESIYPFSGWDILLLAMSVVILGGMGSLPGSIIGAFIISYTRWFSWYYIDLTYGVAYSGLIHLILIVIMLIARPQGILGKKQRT